MQLKVGDTIYLKDDMFIRFYYMYDVDDKRFKAISWSYFFNIQEICYYCEPALFSKKSFDTGFEFVQNLYSDRHEMQQLIKCTFKYNLITHSQ
jgi:hypothetical protein